MKHTNILKPKCNSKTKGIRENRDCPYDAVIDGKCLKHYYIENSIGYDKKWKASQEIFLGEDAKKNDDDNVVE